MSDIFICYSHRDRTIASKLKERLLAEGWSVWMDVHIDAGHRWAEDIQKELDAARYQGAPADGSVWKTGGSSSRVLRGGAWDDAPGSCRAADRVGFAPGFRFNYIGFRVCRGSPIEPLGAAPLPTGPLAR